MTSRPTHRTGALRRLILAGALATATVSTLAVPLTAHAAPTTALPPIHRSDGLVAADAVQALAALRRTPGPREISPMRTYELALDRIAGEIALRLELNPVVLRSAWRKADREHQQAILAAMSQLGVRYRQNSSTPGEGFDCSGLSSYAWGVAGHVLPRSSSAQISTAAARDELTAQAGDLVQYPGHVMIWLGVDRAMVHAPYSGRNVEVDFFSEHRHVRYGDPTG